MHIITSLDTRKLLTKLNIPSGWGVQLEGLGIPQMYINNVQTLSTNNTKYLGVILTKRMKSSYDKTFKSLMKKD